MYTQDAQYGWAPATDRNDHPLNLARQQLLVQPYQPVAGGEQLVVAASPSSKDWRIALATRSGDLLQAWRIVSPDDLEGAVSNAVVGGDPVLAFRVDDVPRHLKEHEVVVLSSTGGLAESLSIGWGAALGKFPQVTDLRVGPDGDLYLMHTDPKRGLTILRYDLAAAPTPTTTPTVTAIPTVTPTGTLPGSPSAPISPASSTPRVAWVVVSLGVLTLAAILVLALWLRRRSQGDATG